MNELAPADERWLSLHAFHHGDLDDLLREAVVPTVADLLAGKLIDSWFFLRYWDGGPHVRVRIRPVPGSETVAAEHLRSALSGYLDDHSPAVEMQPEVYRKMAAALAGGESMGSYEKVLRPQGSVVEIAYRPETEVFGTGPAMLAAEQHFARSSVLAAEVITAGMTPGQRRGLLWSMIVTTLASLEPDRDLLRAALRVELGRDQLPPGLDALPAADPAAAYERQASALAARLDRLWPIVTAEPAPRTDEDGLALELRWRADLYELADALRASGADALPSTAAGSPLARVLGEVGPSQQVVAAILARCAHLLANRLGVSVADEMYLGYLAARTICAGWPGTEDAAVEGRDLATTRRPA